MVSTGELEPAAIVTKLRQALAAITDLSNERAGLEEALKVEKNRDNILPRIMSSSGSYDGLFREEIRKYDKLKVSCRCHCISCCNASRMRLVSCSYRSLKKARMGRPGMW